MKTESINIELTDKTALGVLSYTAGVVLLLVVIALGQSVQAIQVLSEDEMRDSRELLVTDNTAGITSDQLTYLQRENEYGNNNAQSPQTPSLLTISSQQTVIQDARRAVQDRTTDVLQQRRLEYRKSMLAKDPTVLWIRDLSQ